MNLIEISDKFQTELSCIEYAEKVRFGDKIHCAYCNSSVISLRRKDFRHKCFSCNKSTSVTVNTNIRDRCKISHLFSGLNLVLFFYN